MHGENLVVTVRTDQPRFGLSELEAHQDSENAAKGQEHEGGDDIAPADDFMIYCCQRTPKAGRRFPGGREDGIERGSIEIGVASIVCFGAVHHFRLAR